MINIMERLLIFKLIRDFLIIITSISIYLYLLVLTIYVSASFFPFVILIIPITFTFLIALRSILKSIYYNLKESNNQINIFDDLIIDEWYSIEICPSCGNRLIIKQFNSEITNNIWSVKYCEKCNKSYAMINDKIKIK